VFQIDHGSLVVFLVPGLSFSLFDHCDDDDDDDDDLYDNTI